MLLKTPAHADTCALASAVAIGAAMGLLLGGSYLAGGGARAALAHARMARLAQAAADGFSDSALKAEAAGMEPGALAVAMRHDPFAFAGPGERDRTTALLAARLAPAPKGFSQPVQPAPQPLLLRAAFTQPAAAARPFRMSSANPLDGARELDCLTDAVYYEARGESSEGQAAVAQVVLNRVRHPAFPKTICSVVFQGAQSHTCQFSFACDGAMRAPREPAAWRRAQGVAGHALAGSVMRAVGDATHFHVARLGGLWGGGLLRVAQVGAHIFYRFTGHAGAPSSFHAAPDLYVPRSEMAEKSADGAGTADGGSAPTLILASAVTTSPMGQAATPSATSDPVEASKPAPASEKIAATASAAPAKALR